MRNNFAQLVLTMINPRRLARCPHTNMTFMSYNKEYFMRKLLLIVQIRVVFLAALLLCFAFPQFTLAATTDFTVTPVVLDGKGKQREILNYKMTVTNTTNHLVSIYPWVTDVDASIGATGESDLAGTYGKDLSVSLAKWIEVTRGVVDLLPGEHREIPIMVQVHLNAKPGIYHAVIHLSHGANRREAEANTNATNDVLINIEVLDDINERLELNMFAPEKNYFSGDSATFSYRIANIGNRGLVPHGKIHIYDRRGEEVAVIDANQEGKRLDPNAKEMIGSVWAAGDNFGRYKAMLDLQYGNRGTIQDTVFFWIIPWKKMLSMFSMLAMVCAIIAIVLHSRSASARGGAFVPARVSAVGRVQGVIARMRRKDEDGYEEEVFDAPLHKTPLRTPQRVEPSLMQEIVIPRPVTRLPARQHSEPMLLAPRTVKNPVLAEHKVHLAKRAKPQVDPDHVVNLKK
jgi:hypothetical protein